MRFLLAASPWAMARGAALTVVVLLMGAALLGLSGWFVTATGLAGLAGIGIAFDVFRPSAGVRLLALGRAAARYGERLLTHDATLRALAALRVRLLRQQARLGASALAQLRSEATLTRIVADVDALDGLVLRLLLPGIAALATQGAAFLALGWLVGWPVAWAVLCGYLPFSAWLLWRLARRGMVPSEAAETRAQALRRGVIDMIRDREALILSGRIAAREHALVEIERGARAAARTLDRAERDAGFGLSALVAIVSGLAMVAGGWLVSRGEAGAAAAAIGVFVALALAEAVLPLRRGFAEFGRMAGAARRVGSGDVAPEATRRHRTEAPDTAPVLSLLLPSLRLDLRPGEAAALTGPSGAGKTTLLLQVAGLAEGDGIAVLGRAPKDWDEAAFRAIVAMVPQRSALIAGSIRDNLALAGPAGDDAMWAALDAVELAGTIRDRGGLEARLGEAGAGLSGGQARRLALARAILRQPRLLLLDEPTEGLDAETAARVLSGLRRALPQAAILAALHRGAGHPLFGQRSAIAW
jgi:ATP-binding cassette subfamily C protein CydC